MSFHIPVQIPAAPHHQGAAPQWSTQPSPTRATPDFAPSYSPAQAYAAPEPELPVVDAHTVLAAQAGNPQASTHILRSYHDCVFRFLWQMTHRELGDQVTEDICQETFARFFLALRNEPNPLMRPIKSWLLEIARMVALSHLRRIQQVPQSPVAPAQNANAWVSFADAMQDISPAHREILYLRQEQGLSYIEIAQALGVCVGTVKSRLSRSRKALERAMQKRMQARQGC